MTSTLTATSTRRAAKTERRARRAPINPACIERRPTMSDTLIGLAGRDCSPVTVRHHAPGRMEWSWTGR
jgi:hypothetical protein